MENYEAHPPPASSYALKAQRATDGSLEGGRRWSDCQVVGLISGESKVIKQVKTNNSKIWTTFIHLIVWPWVQYKITIELMDFSLPTFPHCLRIVWGKPHPGSPRILHTQQNTDCFFSAVLNVCCRNNLGLQIFLMLCRWQAKGSCNIWSRPPASSTRRTSPSASACTWILSFSL